MERRKTPTLHYSTFIWTGVAFLGISVVIMFAVNTVIGFALLAVGVGNLAVGLSSKRNTNKTDTKNR